MYLSCSMLLILLSLFRNHDNFDTKMISEKRYHEEGWIFTGRFKVKSDQVIVNKEVLTNLYKKQHNEMKKLFT